MANGETPGLQTPVTADVSGFTGGLSRAITKLGGFKGAVGAASGALVAFAGARVMGASVRAFADFDEKMTESQAIMSDLSQQTMAEMEQAALDVSTTTTASAEEAAESFFFLASAGLDAEQSIAALPAVAEFAQAGMFSMARATDLATDAQSALGLKSEDAQQNLRNLTRVTDVLTAANQEANASVEQFADAITNRLGARLRLLNKDIEEGAAALAVLADQGVKGRRAGRGLNIVFRDLASQAVRNAQAFEALNIQVFDQEGNFRNIADVVEDFEGQLEGATAEVQAAKIEQLGLNRRAQDFLSLLIGSSDELREYEGNVQSSGQTSEVAGKQLKTLNRQLGLLRDEASRAGVELGGMIAPGVTSDVRALRIIVRQLGGGLRDTGDAADEGESALRRFAERAAQVGGAEQFVLMRRVWEEIRDRIIESEESLERISRLDLPLGIRAPLPAGVRAPAEETQEQTAREREQQKAREDAAERERVLRQARQRQIEEELGLTSLALQREREKLDLLIQQGAAEEEIANQAARVAEIESDRDRAPGEPVIQPTGVEPGVGFRSQREEGLPASEEVEDAGQKTRDIITSTGDDMDEMAEILESAAIPALDQFAGQLGIGTGAVANFLDSLLTGIAEEFGGGEGLGGTLASLAGGFAGGFQEGGHIPRGQVGLVHEGEALVSGPMNVQPKGAGGRTVVNNEINLNASFIDGEDGRRWLETEGREAIQRVVTNTFSESLAARGAAFG